MTKNLEQLDPRAVSAELSALRFVTEVMLANVIEELDHKARNGVKTLKNAGIPPPVTRRKTRFMVSRGKK